MSRWVLLARFSPRRRYWLCVLNMEEEIAILLVSLGRHMVAGERRDAEYLYH